MTDGVAPDGFAVVDKPGGMTSHDVVARLRRVLRVRRVGHGGTLDPMATGVLVVGVGRGTRLLTYVTGTTKGYTATIRLGARTVTDDAEGEVVATASAAAVTEPAVRAGLAALTGEVEQVPSAVSAVKIDGRRAYRRVREGEQVELPARPVTISELTVGGLRRPTADLLDVEVEVTCSAGTYVRAIARDLGESLAVGGHLVALRRTRVGPFTLAHAQPLPEVDDTDPAERRARVVDWSLAQVARQLFPAREVTAQQARTLSHGGFLAPAGLAGSYAAFDPAGGVVAIVAERDGHARPELVLAAAGGGDTRKGDRA